MEARLFNIRRSKKKLKKKKKYLTHFSVIDANEISISILSICSDKEKRD